MEERRHESFCNLFGVHCKQEFIDIKEDLASIKKILIGNGNTEGSLMYQATMNTNHRKWMESWGKAMLTACVISIFTFGGSLLWIVYSHAKGVIQ